MDDDPLFYRMGTYLQHFQQIRWIRLNIRFKGNTGTLTTIASCAIIGVFSQCVQAILVNPFYSMMMKAD